MGRPLPAMTMSRWRTTAKRARRCARRAPRSASTCARPAGPGLTRPDGVNQPRMSVAGGEMQWMNRYRLVQAPASSSRRSATPPLLDAAQQRVVDHRGGPLLVLAGPGTGKTTTIVEAVAERIEHRGIDPGRILVLTFSRKAAGELRERITARLHRTTREPLALTFHSYAYALVRREFVLAGDQRPRLLSA